MLCNAVILFINVKMLIMQHYCERLMCPKSSIYCSLIRRRESMIEAVNWDTPSSYCADRFPASSKWFHTRSNIWLHKPISQSPSRSCLTSMQVFHKNVRDENLWCASHGSPEGKHVKFFFLIFIIISWLPQASLFSFHLWINLLMLQLLAEADQQIHTSMPFDLPGLEALSEAGDVFICDLSVFRCQVTPL